MIPGVFLTLVNLSETECVFVNFMHIKTDGGHTTDTKANIASAAATADKMGCIWA